MSLDADTIKTLAECELVLAVEAKNGGSVPTRKLRKYFRALRRAGIISYALGMAYFKPGVNIAAKNVSKPTDIVFYVSSFNQELTYGLSLGNDYADSKMIDLVLKVQELGQTEPVDELLYSGLNEPRGFADRLGVEFNNSLIGCIGVLKGRLLENYLQALFMKSMPDCHTATRVPLPKTDIDVLVACTISDLVAAAKPLFENNVSIKLGTRDFPGRSKLRDSGYVST